MTQQTPPEPPPAGTSPATPTASPAGPVRRVDIGRDPAALKALTHPLRIKLLGLLRTDGPATASELAASTGETSASTSYHLRVLARHGFVTEADHRDARERRWRSAHDLTVWDNDALYEQPGAEVFLSSSRRQQVEHLGRSLDRYEADLAAGRLDPAWRTAAHLNDYLLHLTPASAARLAEEFSARATELAARDDGDPEAAPVVVVTAGIPLADGPRRTGEAARARQSEDGDAP
ncbi:ArsR/SmtB family transcription factor [Streptomyces sp. NPDC058372]|uniref:ArsR/SmtB family transcription factor n=1 Tax=unclassified Streptomyces TaxID=2593676 RepID=UPI0036531FFA